MILEKAIVPDIKDGCPTKEDWEARRKLILNTLSEIEYGKRPAVDYAVPWKELLREPVESLHAIHMRTEITVQTSYGAISFPVTVKYRMHFIPVIIWILHSDDWTDLPVCSKKTLFFFLLFLKLLFIRNTLKLAATTFLRYITFHNFQLTCYRSYTVQNGNTPLSLNCFFYYKLWTFSLQPFIIKSCCYLKERSNEY